MPDTLFGYGRTLEVDLATGTIHIEPTDPSLVRDFIDVYINAFGRERHWNTFNVADALLCIGVGLLIIWTSFTGKSAQKRAQQHK